MKTVKSNLFLFHQVPSKNSSEKPPLCAKDQEKEGEPTKISEYFFSDIFMEVDDSE